MPREGTLREQKPEAGLHEVVIRGDGVGQVAFAHDREGNAVGERPRLVWAGGEELDSLLNESLGSGHDLRRGVVAQGTDQLNEEPPRGALA